MSSAAHIVTSITHKLRTRMVLSLIFAHEHHSPAKWPSCQRHVRCESELRAHTPASAVS